MMMISKHATVSLRRRVQRFFLLAVVFAVAAPLACKSSPQQMPNPLARADLSGRIPAKIRKLLPAAVDLDCLKKVTLGSGELTQAFVINWRVADLKGKRYFTAVDVAPAAGTTRGSASAAVGLVDAKGRVSVTIHWGYEQGCTSTSGDKIVYLTLTDPSCTGSQPTNLFDKKAKPSK